MHHSCHVSLPVSALCICLRSQSVDLQIRAHDSLSRSNEMIDDLHEMGTKALESLNKQRTTLKVSEEVISNDPSGCSFYCFLVAASCYLSHFLFVWLLLYLRDVQLFAARALIAKHWT